MSVIHVTPNDREQILAGAPTAMSVPAEYLEEINDKLASGELPAPTSSLYDPARDAYVFRWYCGLAVRDPWVADRMREANRNASKPVPFWDDPAVIVDIFGPDPCKYAPDALRRCREAFGRVA